MNWVAGNSWSMPGTLLWESLVGSCLLRSPVLSTFYPLLPTEVIWGCFESRQGCREYLKIGLDSPIQTNAKSVVCGLI